MVSRARAIVTVLLTAAIGIPAATPAIAAPPADSAAQRSNVPGLTTEQYNAAFVRREGSRLEVAGRPFRFVGANVEWLGLASYGPNPSSQGPEGSERYPSRYEIDDVFATLHEMGATVVRAQTLGDTVGCALCLEPQLGQFNPAAFAHMDMVVAEARRYGIKLIGEFSGDANGAPAPGQVSATSESHDWYCTWETQQACGPAFFTNPAIIADYERHMAAVLNHVNPLTGLAYKDDPVFAGWVDGNNLDLLDGVPTPIVEQWLRRVSDHFEALDPNQLFINISLGGGDGFVTPTSLQIPNIDLYALEYYPHWFPVVSGGNRVDGNAPFLHAESAQVAAAGKAFTPIEFGWNDTNFLSQKALRSFLAGLAADPDIAGDLFWALQSHAEGHGWQPIPADAGCRPTCQWGEDGNWWALYYTGLGTASNTASDMAARAQLLRDHAYQIDGFASTPPHEAAPAPVITSTTGGHVLFEGSAGSPAYSVQKLAGDNWVTVCDHCTTDAADGWTDPSDEAACYRVIGENLDGIPGKPSEPAGRCPAGVR